MTDESSSGATSSPDSAYEVLIDDNFHYMDEDERYSVGVFKTYDKALARAKRIVERSLRDLLEPGTSVSDLTRNYVMFGEDPFIRPTPEGVERFSARDYARERIPEILKSR